MSRRSFILPRDRAAVIRLASSAEAGVGVTFTKDKRTADQNSLLWGLLHDVATQTDWHGVKLSEEDWKTLFMEALDRDTRMVPNLTNDGFVGLGRSTSRLTKDEFSQLITLIIAFGDKRSVRFKHKPMPSEFDLPGQQREAA